MTEPLRCSAETNTALEISSPSISLKKKLSKTSDGHHCHSQCHIQGDVLSQGQGPEKWKCLSRPCLIQALPPRPQVQKASLTCIDRTREFRLVNWVQHRPARGKTSSKMAGKWAKIIAFFSLSLFLKFSFCFSYKEVPGQGSDLSHCCSCSNTGSFNPLCGAGD